MLSLYNTLKVKSTKHEINHAYIKIYIYFLNIKA